MIRIFALIIILAIVGSAGACGKANAHHRITVVAPITAWSWPLYIAKEGGYYDRQGLDVNLVFANHPAGLAMLTSGEAQVNLNSLQQAMQVSTKDDSFVIVGSPLRKWLFALIADQRIASASDLKGRRLGVAQMGDSTYNYALSLLAKFGIRLQDIELVVTGAEGRVAALVNGRVDAAMLSAPAYYKLERAGYKSVANISDYEDIHTPSVLLFNRRTLEDHPKLPELLIKAHAEAVKRYYDDRDFALKAHLVYDKQDTADLRRVYESYVKTNALERAPYILDAAVRYVLENAPDARLSAAMKGFDYRRTIDNSPVDRLAQEGFFEDLFGADFRVEQGRKAKLAFR